MFSSRPLHPPRPDRAPWLLRAVCAAGLLAACLPGGAPAQQHHAPEGEGHEPHFSHPLVGEPVAPVTEAGLAYRGGREGSQLELSVAYAPRRSIGVEVGVALAPGEGGGPAEPAVHLGLHLASYALARHGVVLGYGVEWEIPADRAEPHAGHGGGGVRPFVGVAYRRGELEVSGSARLGLAPRAEAAPGSGPLSYSVAALHPLAPRVHGLLEIYGGAPHGHGGQPSPGPRVAPAVTLRPFRSVPLLVGAGISTALPGAPDAALATRFLVQLHR